MMKWSEFHGSLQLKIGCHFCVIPMSLSVLMPPRAREYICIGILIDCKERRFTVTQILLYISSRNRWQFGRHDIRIKTWWVDNRIREWGPKNYAYTLIDTWNVANQTKKTVCKFRGITLNYNASQLVNFDVMKDMILYQEPSHTVTVHTEHKIKRNRNLWEGIVSIITEPEDKKYRVWFLKRRRLLDNTSEPVGYI